VEQLLTGFLLKMILMGLALGAGIKVNNYKRGAYISPLII